jgi:hypothetical protein
LAVLALAGSGASAAGPKGPVGPNRVFLMPDGMAVATRPSASHLYPRNLAPGEAPIYDNLAGKYPDGTYYCCVGWVVSGPDVPLFGQTWLAAAFTPANNTSVTRVDLGIGFVSGNTNALVVTLNSDASGAPGTELAKFEIRNMPMFGSCCAVATVKDKAGTALVGGQQYWVVVKTNNKDSDIWANWNSNDTEQINPVPGAYNAGSGWITGNYLVGMAFAVFGK